MSTLERLCDGPYILMTAMPKTLSIVCLLTLLIGVLHFRCIVLATSAGVVDHKDAERKNVGGQYLVSFI